MNRKNKFYKAHIAVFSICLLLSMIISLAFPLRPKFSEVEKRQLAEFPKFSVEKLEEGTYFDGIDKWFSDTFPGRDILMSLNALKERAYGIQKTQIHGDIGESDEIPDAPRSDKENN